MGAHIGGPARSLGLRLAEGPWGQPYQVLAAQGHAYYQRAHFFTRSELAALLATAGLQPKRTRSALFHGPEAEPTPDDVREGDDPTAGFTALLCVVDTLPPHDRSSSRNH